MSFKLNDYNAFLTSLFDKNNPQSQPGTPNHSQNQPGDPHAQQVLLSQHQQQLLQHQSQQLQNQRLQSYAPSQVFENEEDINDSASFPVDFDFGLIAPGNGGPQSNVNQYNRSKSIHFPVNDSQNHGNITEFMGELGGLDNNNNPPSVNNSYSSSITGDSTLNTNNNHSVPEEQTANNLFGINYVNTNATSVSDYNPNVSNPSTTAANYTPLASPLSLGLNNEHQQPQESMYIKQEPLPVLPAHNSQQLHQQASSYNFSKVAESPSPLNQSPPKMVTRSAKQALKGKRFKQEEEDLPLLIGPTQGHPRPRVKSAHNVIEQRYRNKINDKFTALQNSVPTLRVVAKRKQRQQMSGEDYDSSDEEVPSSLRSEEDIIELEGLEPARKLNKGTILAKSIEYIKFLELKNDRMKMQHEELLLKARMLGLVINDDLINPEVSKNQN
ncbi:uncharacterized protein RJT20DRAFT_9263 [Scheffersomyces xylosifermentans]|uniref:uncharacterized protein n=1 Tax=Scheffersomyces xylosifermentans TaxID=1304137 RepID=UPI00315C5E52